MTDIEALGNAVLRGKEITREEALALYAAPLEPLAKKADEIRARFCGNAFDLCAILNAKSGRCPENCKFCAQSARYATGAEEYPLLRTEEIVHAAKIHAVQGVLRYSLVTSGRRLTDDEVEKICEAARAIRQETNLSVCVSCGLLNEAQFRALKEAGISRAHNNLETSRRNFPNICTTHTFEDKIAAIRAAQAAGLTVCSGGLMGLGETPQDRVDMALTLRVLGIKSVPLNLLHPIPGTPLAAASPLSAEELRRIVAIYRFLLPDAAIRLAGGRSQLPDRGRSCFVSGANAAISGGMLTTAGVTVQTDRNLLKELGYEVRPIEA